MWAHKLPRKDIAILLIVFVFDEVQHLREVQTLDPSLADHLQLALKSRLKVLCALIFDFDRSKKLTRKSENLPSAICIDYIEETSSCLPPHYRGCSYKFWLAVRDQLPPRLTATRLDSPLCLLSRSNSNERHHDAPQTDDCCCGWTFDSIPSGVLNFFGHSAQSFARHFHARQWVISFAEVELAFKARELMNTVFRRLGMEKVSLQKKMTIFREALYLTLRLSFFLTHQMNTHTTIMLPEDQLSAQAEGHRQQLLVIILEAAVSIYHVFWASRREGQTDAKSIHQLISDFSLWKENSPEVENTRRSLVRVLVGLHFRRRNLITGVCFDDYMKSLTIRWAAVEVQASMA